ncbi:MAG TPA: peptidoglycan DD-metalloendopeptidase family protein [Solirubrobacteraceae bacterium]|nr:peptidoglycan DD-metalloendopeptidase family protein [Solirubrobacteraceae bacterium]
MRLRIALLTLLSPLALWAALPLASSAGPAERAAQLERRIDAARERVERRLGTERNLRGDVRSYSERIDRLEGRIDELRTRQERLEADLAAKEAELSATQEELRRERARLARLRKRLVEARQALATRLVELYKAGDQDLLAVVLNADGFAELLERGEFLQRISEADREVINVVRRAREDAKRTEARLDRLEERQQELVTEVRVRRDQVADTKGELIGTRVGAQRTREGKQNALEEVRSERVELEEDLEAMEAEQEKIERRLMQAGGGGPIRQGSGDLIWPVNGAFTSPFGQRWGRLHAGIDIAAPTGTPIRAADSGKVVLMAPTGGYGNYTCVAHGGSLSTCYAHQSSFATSVGANVRKGQVIGRVGNTGNSTGAHLHFETRVNGTPRDPMGYL